MPEINHIFLSIARRVYYMRLPTPSQVHAMEEKRKKWEVQCAQLEEKLEEGQKWWYTQFARPVPPLWIMINPVFADYQHPPLQPNNDGWFQLYDCAAEKVEKHLIAPELCSCS